MRPNTLRIGVFLVALFLVSLVAGYVVGELYLKPRPAAAPGAMPRAVTPRTTPGPAAVSPRPAVPPTPRTPATPGARAMPATPAAETSPVVPSTPAPSATGPRPTPSPPEVASEEEQATPAAALYRVQVGAFSARERADDLALALKQDGFQPYVVKESGLYKVRAGAFRERRLAEQLADQLRAKGYQVAILR